jgi:AcrR family transcriptional regulator
MSTKTKAKRAGRPPSTSREEILDTALSLLKEGQEAFSIRNLASRLGTAPTSIYNYFTNKEELLDALAERALSDLWVDCRGEGEWRDQLRRWMHAFHAALVAAPELMHLIGLACASPSFLADLKQLNDLIAKSGLDERSCALHAQSLLWTVLGFAFQETNASNPKMKRRMKTASKKFPYPEMTRHLAIADFADLWAITVEREIAGVRSPVEKLRAK